MPGSGIDKKYGNDELAMAKQYSNDGTVNLDALIKRLTGGKKIKKKFDGKPPLYPDLDKAQYEPDGKLVDEETTDVKPLDVLLKNAVPGKINNKRKGDPNMTPSMLKRYRENMNASYQPEDELVEATMTPTQKRKDTMLKKKYEKSDDMMDNFKDQYGEKKGKEVFYAYIRKKSMQVEQLGGTAPKVAPSSQEMKKKLTTVKNNNLEFGNISQRQKIQSDLENMGNQRVTTTTTSGTGAGGLKDMSISDAGTVKSFQANAINKLGKMGGAKLEMDSGGLVPNVGKFVQDVGKNALAKNSLVPDAMKGQLNKGLANTAQQINQQTPGTDAFKQKTIAMQINKNTRKNQNLKASYNMDENITDEALTIQDWNSDDIKFTEIETVDIIKPKPLRPSPSNWREELSETPDRRGQGAGYKMTDNEFRELQALQDRNFATGGKLIKNKKQSQKLTDKYMLELSRRSKDVGPGEFKVDRGGKGRIPVNSKTVAKNFPNLKDHYNWRDELGEDWQKVNKKDKTDGMSQKAVNAYKRENPGSKLKTAVTTKPSKLKKGSKASKRRKSFCARSDGQRKMHNIDCSKTPDKAICKARRRWNC